MSDVYVIGGMAMDIEGISCAPIIPRDSNPGTVATSHGGVGRNICENLRRLGADVGMISVVGNDDIGRALIKNLMSLGVDLEHVKVLPDGQTAMYLSIMTNEGEIEVAIAGMEILDRIGRAIIDEAMDDILKAKMLVVDTNIPEDSIRYLCEKVAGRVPLFLDAVSSPKSIKAKNVIGQFYGVKLNRAEAGAILDMKIDGLDDVKLAGQKLIDKGVRRVYITLGADGAYYCDEKGEGFAPAIVAEDVVSTTGSGDAFSAMLVRSYLDGVDTATSVQYATAASNIALHSLAPVSKEMSLEAVQALADISKRN